ncbi:MAG: DUF4198 domain-containing protein [Thermodesulfobacteriota bacterium]
MRHITIIAAALIFVMFAAPAVFAHHLWIEPSNSAYAVVRGILPDRIDNYDPDCIREINAFGTDGAVVAIERTNEKDRVVFKADDRAAMATAWSEWGYRVNTTRGKRLMGRIAAENEGLRVISAFFSTHYAKSLFGPSAAVSEPTGLRFEIIPRKDPAGAKPGDEIEFLVLFDGKPLAKTSLYAKNGDKASTNANGIAVMTVPDQPTALLYARHRIDVNGDEKKDYDIFTTFLTFEVNR